MLFSAALGVLSDFKLTSPFSPMIVDQINDDFFFFLYEHHVFSAVEKLKVFISPDVMLETTSLFLFLLTLKGTNWFVNI